MFWNDIKRSGAVAALLALTISVAGAGECESSFREAGSPFSGADYSATVTLRDQSIADAMAQMRGVLISEKMDVLTQDEETGTMLVEERRAGAKRPIPSLIGVDAVGVDAAVSMTIKTEKGMLASKDAMQGYLCGVLAKLQDGDAGRLAAKSGAATQNADDVTVKDVYIFSREIAREAKGNALAVGVRHKGRRYALHGRVDYIQEDGEDFNVSFDIPEPRDSALQLPFDDEARVGVACLFRPNQLANVLTFRKGEKANFTGAFYRYDDFKRMVWLQNCKQTAG